MYILEMHTEWENMIWQRKKLQERLQRAIRERGLLEELLAELEDEHDEAICKLEQLEGEVNNWSFCKFNFDVMYTFRFAK